MYPFNKRDVENDVLDVVNSFSSFGRYTDTDFYNQIMLMLSEINMYGFSKIEDERFYSESKYTRERAGRPVCSFAKYAFNENWNVLLEGVSSDINMAILKNTTLYQDYVTKIKNSSEYISIQRNNRLLLILD